MATPNIVPRADSEGQLGTSSKYWAAAYIDLIYVGAGKIGRDADNLLDFSVDNEVTFRVNATDEMVLSASSLSPQHNRSLSLGTSALRWKDLHLGDAAIINFNNGDIKLTHSNNVLEFTGGLLRFADNQKATFGNSNDLEIFHEPSNGIIDNKSGHLYVKNTATDGQVIFELDNGAGSVIPYLILDGSNAGFTTFPDNTHLAIGTDRDFRMSFDGTNATLAHHTGDLIIKNNADDGDIIFQSDPGDGGNPVAYLTLDGGSVVTIASKNIKFSDGVRAQFGDNLDIQIHHTGGSNFIEIGSGNIDIRNNSDDGDIAFSSDNGSGGVATYLTLDGGVQRNILSQHTSITDNMSFYLGSGLDFGMHHDGTCLLYTSPSPRD